MTGAPLGPVPSATLRDCAVMITVAGGFRGSGFLVAPGLAVTAAHVLRGNGRPGSATGPVAVRHASGESPVTTEDTRVDPASGRAQLVEADHGRTSDPLAVLSVSGPVLELIRERLGGQWSTGFTEVPPAGADPRTGGTTHTFTGSTLLLGRALAGSAGGDRPGPW
ncbi:hypothetical protein [Streptomyces sp. BE303]|uniref:hypothetical protein n=1 Tax=Streptomyces sp. BE303 TaxID=3002528 RepID=UPI002E799581|nr:hypothetical protein [Streptomyces sp. BE303]MED7952820.1 hypothetical protein [Streptomyces sp. BE303]